MKVIQPLSSFIYFVQQVNILLTWISMQLYILIDILFVIDILQYNMCL